jgi:hypothetical protein
MGRIQLIATDIPDMRIIIAKLPALFISPRMACAARKARLSVQGSGFRVTIARRSIARITTRPNRCTLAKLIGWRLQDMAGEALVASVI